MKKNTQKGTTVIELLIYLALLAVFMTVLLDVFVTTLNLKLSSESTSSLNQDTRYIMSKISYDVFNADSITVPGNTELDFVSGGITNKYTVIGGDLLLNSVKLNGLDTKVGSISFTKIGSTVQVILTMQSQIQLPGGASTQSVQTTVGLR